MAAPATPLQQQPARRAPREEATRIVEYAPFPRVSGEPGTRLGFTRDLSPLGLCIGVDASEPRGALLRVSLRGIDGEVARRAVARVVWCGGAERDGRYWVGLEYLAALD